MRVAMAIFPHIYVIAQKGKLQPFLYKLEKLQTTKCWVVTYIYMKLVKLFIPTNDKIIETMVFFYYDDLKFPNKYFLYKEVVIAMRHAS